MANVLADIESSISINSDELSLSTPVSSTGADGEPMGSPDDDEAKEVKQVKKMAKKETKRMRAWKVVLLISIVVTAGVVSGGTFWFLQKVETDDYENSYYLFANTVEDAAQFHLRNIFLATRTCADAITAASIATNASFPEVKVPQFEVVGGAARTQSGLELLLWTPLVNESEGDSYLQFTGSNQGWLEESRELAVTASDLYNASDYIKDSIPPIMWERDEDLNIRPTTTAFPLAPIWQVSPPPFNPGFVNFNMMSFYNIREFTETAQIVREGIIGNVLDLSRLGLVAQKPADHEAYHDRFVDWDKDANNEVEKDVNGENLSAYGNPHSIILEPIFSKLYDDTSDMVGMILAVLPWDRYLTNLLPEGVEGIYVVLRNSWGQAYTYEISGNRAFFMGEGDFHDERYSDHEVVIPFETFKRNETAQMANTTGHAVYSFSVYPSAVFEDEYRSVLPIVMTVVVATTFFVMALTFFAYDFFVQRRNNKVINAAARTGAIVSSMFPSNVRDRLFAEKEEAKKKESKKEEAKKKESKRQSFDRSESRLRLKDFMDDDANLDYNEEDGDDDYMFKTKPIADLFPETSILFADLAGFTAWSSTREPSHVFILLETIYRAFDEIAKKRRVFKVETVGDCYVAVTGLPDPRKDHAIAMARFARDCVHRMNSLTTKLEVKLGPDTADLALRVGIHSGPVTAGVLRGEKSRFQLFGDTMNTASRMESTGVPNRIQVSQETADLLCAAGKSNWLVKREDRVVAKGKGELQTYFVSIGSGSRSSGEFGTERGSYDSCSDFDTDGNASDDGGDLSKVPEQLEAQIDCSPMSAKTKRLIKWNVEVLSKLLKRVQARREASGSEAQTTSTSIERDIKYHEPGETVLDEVQEIIRLPDFSASETKDSVSVKLDPLVEEQLEKYVAAVASMYRDNPFHCFEHASHVTASVVKLMSRIVAPSHVKCEGSSKESTLHDHTYGITSDPLTQFACVFSALIHDVDHMGVPNAQLIEENPKLAEFYKKKSVAEQNSVDLAWELLMDETYVALRNAIYQTRDEKKRFRQLVVNSVMATDIMDKSLKALRNNRWDKAFSESSVNRDESEKDRVDRKATIVIEHLIQASDVVHTMQHWHVYRKWNQRLFEELYKAYVSGRADKDPSEFWYQGEIGFFDFYIIPLAKKLKDCGVFGVSSDEYLNYAMKNRNEWEEKGKEVVAEMVEQTRAALSGQTSALGPLAEIQQRGTASQTLLNSVVENSNSTLHFL